MRDLFSKRIRIALVFTLVLAGTVISRLFYLQVIKSEQLKKLGEREFKRAVSELGSRGRILDAEGEILADSITVWDIVIMKKELVPGQDAPGVLSSALKIPRSEITRKLAKSKNYIKINKKADKTIYDSLNPLIISKKLSGVILEPHQQRIYPSGEIGSEIIGLSNEEKGLTQIELIYNQYLRGSLKTKEVIRDAAGNVIYDGNETQTKNPDDVYLTIDKKIQFITEETLKKYGSYNKSDLAVAIVQNVKTGEIAAMGSYPPDKINLRPVEWVYEPGSTFKTVTLAASLEEKSVKESDSFYCEKGAWAFNSKVTIHDHEPEATLKLNEVFEKSSNIGFAKIGLKLGIEKLYIYLKSFGFGSKTGLEFQGESRGLLRDLKDYKQIDLAVTSYGHSIGVTPIQVVNAYSAIASGGILKQPHILKKITDPSSGKELIKGEYQEIRRAVSQETAKKVTKMLIGVVDRGTGKNAQIIGYSVAGKTGTSNKLDLKTGKYVEKKNVASFCGFFPASDPQYTVLVILDNPKKFYYGGETAAPAFSEIAKRIITLKNIKPDRPFNYKDALKTNYSQKISD